MSVRPDPVRTNEPVPTSARSIQSGHKAHMRPRGFHASIVSCLNNPKPEQNSCIVPTTAAQALCRAPLASAETNAASPFAHRPGRKKSSQAAAQRFRQSSLVRKPDHDLQRIPQESIAPRVRNCHQNLRHGRKIPRVAQQASPDRLT